MTYMEAFFSEDNINRLILAAQSRRPLRGLGVQEVMKILRPCMKEALSASARKGDLGGEDAVDRLNAKALTIFLSNFPSLPQGLPPPVKTSRGKSIDEVSKKYDAYCTERNATLDEYFPDRHKQTNLR